MDLLDRPLAITDIETTGLDPIGHEIIEIGLVLADQKTLEIREQWTVKIQPEHIETAEPEALAVNGYKAEEWVDAYKLKLAMKFYQKKTTDAIFVAHNVTFDWSFIYEAFSKCDLTSTMDYHRLDLFSIAWGIHPQGLMKYNLVALCEHFGIPKEPDPHKAINGAIAALEVLRKLRSLKDWRVD